MNCEASILAQAAKMTGAKIIKHLDDIACSLSHRSQL